MSEYHPGWMPSKNERYSMEAKRINNKYDEKQREKSIFKNKYDIEQQRKAELDSASEKIYGRSGGGFFYE